jgi:hypothetical protein
MMTLLAYITDSAYQIATLSMMPATPRWEVPEQVVMRNDLELGDHESETLSIYTAVTIGTENYLAA